MDDGIDGKEGRQFDIYLYLHNLESVMYFIATSN